MPQGGHSTGTFLAQFILNRDASSSRPMFFRTLVSPSKGSVAEWLGPYLCSAGLCGHKWETMWSIAHSRWSLGPFRLSCLLASPRALWESLGNGCLWPCLRSARKLVIKTSRSESGSQVLFSFVLAL